MEMVNATSGEVELSKSQIVEIPVTLNVTFKSNLRPTAVVNN